MEWLPAIAKDGFETTHITLRSWLEDFLLIIRDETFFYLIVYDSGLEVMQNFEYSIFLGIEVWLDFCVQ